VRGACVCGVSPFSPKTIGRLLFLRKIFFFQSQIFVCVRTKKKGNLWRDPLLNPRHVFYARTKGKGEESDAMTNDQNATTTTTKEEDREKRRRRRQHAMDATEKNAKKWALEEFVWDSDKAVGMKIRGVRTEMEEKDEEEDEEDDDDAKVNDLRNSPRLRSMVRASEDIEEDKRKYFERREKNMFTTDSANDNGARATAMAKTSNDKREVAANSNTAVPADFIPAKLRSEEARETKYRIVRHQVYCKVDGCNTECESLYSIRVKVCAMHLKADEVLFNGETCRFCQKCTKFHNVNAFENNRRACLRSLNRLASKRMPRIAPASAENTLNSYARLMTLHAAGLHEAAINGDNARTIDAFTANANNKRDLASLLLSYNKWYQGCAMIAKNKEQLQEQELKRQQQQLLLLQLQQLQQRQRMIESTVNASEINAFRLKCAQTLMNHLPENYDPLKDEEERRRKEIINASYRRSEGYDQLMHLDTEAFIAFAAQVKIHNKQPHDLSASLGEGIKNYFVEKSGNPPASLEFTAEPGCTKLNIDALIPPMASRRSYSRRLQGTSDQDIAQELAGCAIETDDGGLDNADVDVIVGSARTRRINGEWEKSSDVHHKYSCSSVTHAMCTNPDVLKSCKNENSIIITGVPPDVAAVVRINGQVERRSVISRLGGNAPMPTSIKATKRRTEGHLNRINNRNNREQQKKESNVLQNMQSNYIYVSVPLDYAEGLMTVNLMWPEGHEFAGCTICDPIVIILSPYIKLAQELKGAMDEVHTLSSGFCYTLKRYIGACLVKDGNSQSFRNPNFCTIQRDITLWSLRNGFAKLSKRLLEPQVQMLQNARSLIAADGVYKTYVYAATLSDSIDIVREVIALGGEQNLFGTVSTVGNKETKDTALHIAAMNGNIDMVLDFLSIIPSVDYWFTLRNSSGFSPRDCAILAQRSNLSKTIAKVLDEPLLIASNAVCLAVKEVLSKIANGSHIAPNCTPAIDHVEELENQSEVIFDHASDLVFESLSEIGSIIPATAHEKVRKHGSVRLLEITNRLLHHNACFLKLFSLAIERDCQLLDNYSSADSADNSFDSPILSGADSFFLKLLETYESKRRRRYVPQSLRKVFGRWSNSIASLKHKSMLAFEDPLIEKAYVLENSFYRRSVDLVAFLVIFSVICCRKYKFSDGLGLSFFRMEKLSKFYFYIPWLIGVSTFPAVIFTLLMFPKFYTRHREGITMLVGLTNPLIWPILHQSETIPVSAAKVTLMRLSSCVYGCRFERHAIAMMINYFIPLTRRIEIFSGKASDLAHSTVVEEFDRFERNNVLSLGAMCMNLVITLLIEVRCRRKFAGKYGVDWMKRSWSTATPCPPEKDEKFNRDIRKEVGAFYDDEDDIDYNIRNRQIRFISAAVSETRKALYAKAYLAFSNPRDEDAYMLENSIFRRPYDLAVHGLLYLTWASSFTRHYLTWNSFDWLWLGLFTNCNVNEDTMRIQEFDRRFSALVVLKLFAYLVFIGTSLVTLLLPRVYCRYRESFVVTIKAFCGILPAMKVSETPEICVVLICRLCAVLWSVRFEREVLLIFLNAFIIPRALDWYNATEEYTIVKRDGNTSVVTCKGNSSSISLGIFSGKWYHWSFFFKCMLVILVYLQMSVIFSIEKQRREGFARKRKIKYY